MYTMPFSAGLNRLQVERVNIENYSQSSRQTQFIASELVAACMRSCTHLQVHYYTEDIHKLYFIYLFVFCLFIYLFI